MASSPSTRPAQRGLFDSCTATLENVAAYVTASRGELGCPQCGGPPDEHEPEALIADTVPEDADFGEWLMNLPRSPS